MTPRPPNFDDARKRGLIAVEGQGIHTFSNGTQYECWAEGNCERCKWFDPDEAGALCAFEMAGFLGIVSPELARLFGWIWRGEEKEKAYGAKFSFDPPRQCAFFKDRDDDSPDPPIIDPTQLTFLAPDQWPTVDAPVEVHA